MYGIVVTARVKDANRWEKAFRSHQDLFKRGHISLIHYTITKDNDVAMYGEVDDETAYERAFQSPETMKAMEEDGVEMNTVKTFRLDKEIKPS